MCTDILRMDVRINFHVKKKNPNSAALLRPSAGNEFEYFRTCLISFKLHCRLNYKRAFLTHSSCLHH